MTVHMKPIEILKLMEYLVKCEKLFEFGCGGSTTLMCDIKNIKTIHSVDSSKNWINSVQKEVGKKVNFHFVDINADELNWGSPKDKTKISEWPTYSSVLKDLVNYYPDLILVDGRFRVACALKSIARMKKDSYLMIHDYTTLFQTVENYFNIVDKAGSLYVFSKKNNIDEQALKKDIKKYEYICD